MAPDDELLRQYVADKSDAAFAELVQRHLPLVYATALRQVGGDAHLAHDVAQAVFMALARKASTLTGRATLAGWLYLGAHHASAQAVRSERRRQTREQTAHAMQHLHSPAETSADWARVQPAIDDALHALNDADREAVLLRFFERRPFAEIGAGLRISEDAARMRVERALEKLRAALARRGITSTAAALAGALTGPAAAAATALPLGLTASVTQAALAGAAAQGAALTTGAVIIGFMSTSKIITATSVAIAALTTTIAYQQHHYAQVATATATAAAQTTPAAPPPGADARIENLTAQLARANQRVAEVEKDNDDLLKAIAGRGPRAVAPNAPAENDEKRMVLEKAIADQEARRAQDQLAIDRAYQQGLARHKQAEARQRAQLVEDAAINPNALPARFDLAKLVAGAQQLMAQGDFEGAIALFQLAIRVKTPEEPLPEAAMRGLQEALLAQSERVEVTLVSDGITLVGLSPSTPPRRLATQTLRLAGGNYEVLGMRNGYETLSIPLQIRPGMGPINLSVICSVPTAK